MRAWPCATNEAGEGHEDMRARVLIVAACASALVGPRAAADPAPGAAEESDARAQAAAAVSTMETLSRRCRSILMEARRLGEDAAIACADEGLTRVDVALRYGREHAGLLALAWSRGDARQARRELALLSLADAGARAAGARAGR